MNSVANDGADLALRHTTCAWSQTPFAAYVPVLRALWMMQPRPLGVGQKRRGEMRMLKALLTAVTLALLSGPHSAHVSMQTSLSRTRFR